MEAVLMIFARCIRILLSVVSFAMLCRVLLSFFPLEEGNRTEMFLYALTEPFIIPVRALFYKWNIGQDTPIDLPFTVSYILMALMQMFLPAV